MAPIHRNVLRIDDNANNDNANNNDAPAFANNRPAANIRLVRDEKPMFSSLEQTGSRQNALLASVTIHIVGVTLLIVLPLFLMDSLRVPRYDAILLSPPIHKDQILEVTHWKAPALPEPKPKPMVAPPPIKPAVVKIEPPKQEPKVPETHFQPKPALVAAVLPQPEAPPMPKPTPVAPPKPAVKTGGFGDSALQATVNLPARKVQTGGFGDPNGIKGEGNPNKPANIASLGAFDLPVGAGAGNGTGGANGVRGVVASSGFGNGVASSGSGRGGGHAGGSGVVTQGGFGDAQAAKEPVERKHDFESQATPVEITFKPRPDYTDEARKQKLEGEVLLHVLFAASGHIQVLDVVRGLGHGLDQNAIHAAEQIRFKPALKDGKAVDSMATVHILFQLAY